MYAAEIADTLSFAEDVCNATTLEDQYDLEHIRQKPLSFFFQTLVFLRGHRVPCTGYKRDFLSETTDGPAVLGVGVGVGFGFGFG